MVSAPVSYCYVCRASFCELRKLLYSQYWNTGILFMFVVHVPMELRGGMQQLQQVKISVLRLLYGL